MAQQTSTSKKSTTTTKRSKSATAKPAVKSAAAKVAKQQETEGFSPDERQRMIAEAAYLMAERRGFQGGNEMDDWLQAEAEVDAQFASRH